MAVKSLRIFLIVTSVLTMGRIDRDALKHLASKYIWWKTPDEAVAMPQRVMAQVMAIGDYDDVQQLVHQVGDDVLRDVIALRLGHRASVDFDFFSDEPHDRDAIHAAFPFIARSTDLQDQGNTLTLLVASGISAQDRVKVSFFGTIGFGRVGEPDTTEDRVLPVAVLSRQLTALS